MMISTIASGRLGVRSGALVVAVAVSIASPASTFGAKPDPRSLLQGVEATRLGILPGRIEWELTDIDFRHPKAGPSRTRLVVVFDGDKRRYDQYLRILWIDGPKTGGGDLGFKKLEAMGGDGEAFVRAGLGEWKDVHIRSAFDGSQFMQYNKEMGAYVRDVSKGSADYAFDPRVMGLSCWYDLNATVPGCLGYRDAKSVKLVAPESVSGHPTWHVLVVDKSDRERHFWIEDTQGFRVRKFELRSEYQHETTISEYDERGGNNILPTRVVDRDYGRAGNSLEREQTFVQKSAEFGIIPDPKAWTLAGLEIPVGEAVIDEKIRRVVGHWDGDGLTADFLEAKRKGAAARWWPLHWGMVVTGGIILAALTAVVVQRRGLLRRGV